jgi:hypothetical protein
MALIAIRHVVTLPGASGADPVTIGFDPVGGVVTRLISTALFAGRQPKRMADSGQSGEAKRDKVMKC